MKEIHAVCKKMTRNGPEIVILKYGSIFIASDVIYVLEYGGKRPQLKHNILGSKKFFTFTGIPTLDFGTLEHSLLAVWTAKEYLYMKPLPQLAQKNFNSDVSGWATSKGQMLYLKFSLNPLRFS